MNERKFALLTLLVGTLMSAMAVGWPVSGGETGVEATVQQAIHTCMAGQGDTDTTIDDLQQEGIQQTNKYKKKTIASAIGCVVNVIVFEGFGMTGPEFAALWHQGQDAQRTLVTRAAVKLLDSLLQDPVERAKAIHQFAAETTARVSSDTLVPLLVEVMLSQSTRFGSTSDSNGGPGYPFWRMVPKYKGAVLPSSGTDELKFKTRCYRNISITAKLTPGPPSETLHVEYSAESGTSLLCVDLFLFFSAGALHPEIIFYDTKQKHIGITPKPGPGVPWMMQMKGVQVYNFINVIDAIGDFMSTAALFLGPMSSFVPNVADAMDNAMFFNAYSEIQPGLNPRNDGSSSNGTGNGGGAPHLSKTPQTGDLLLVTRMDGEDTMISWLTGTNVAHVAMLACDDDSGLKCSVCETRYEALWWPSNGVECNPLEDWLQWANNGTLIVSHLPALEPTTQSLNATMVKAFVANYSFLDYGYQIVVWSWVDVLENKNFPCFPSDFDSHCIVWEHIELFYVFLDTLSSTGSEFGHMLGASAFGNRIESGGYMMPVTEAIKKAWTMQNKTAYELMVEPEQDDYIYFSLRNGDHYYGRTFTDASLVCEFLRNSGPGAPLANLTDLNCAEQTAWNILRLNFWNASQAYQVLGDYTLAPMSDVGTVAPYERMGNQCPSQPPLYERPENC